MKKITAIIALALVLSGTSSFAWEHHHDHDGVLVGATTSGALLGSTIANCSAGRCKEIVAAKDDAAYFVATAGEARSAVLDQAFQEIRMVNPDLRASDMDLAIEIMNQE